MRVVIADDSVLLREGLRAPIYLRRLRKFVHPDARTYTAIHELVAGLLEERDGVKHLLPG